MTINKTEQEQAESPSERGEIPNGQLLGFASKLMGLQEQKVLKKTEGTTSTGGEDYKGDPKLMIRTELQEGMTLTSSQNHNGETHTFRVKAKDGSEDVARVFVSPDRKATVFINDEPTSDPEDIAKFGALFDVPFSVAESPTPVYVEATQDQEDTIEEARTEVVEDLFEEDTEIIAGMEKQFEESATEPEPEQETAPEPEIDLAAEETHHHEIEEKARHEVETVLAEATTEAAGEEIIEAAEQSALEVSPEEPSVPEDKPIVDVKTNPADIAKTIIEAAQEQPKTPEQSIRPATKMEADYIKQVIAGEYLANGAVRHIFEGFLRENDKKNERKAGESAQRLIERASSGTIELSARARAALNYIQDQNARGNSSIWETRPSASAIGRVADQLQKSLQILAHELGR
ncbi:MAG: hypothetical protein JWM52_436 [Candidatus Saccharibacteria bacterium]|nr:hypothetical protein [Candidatus Saccharibacteria bacterium]